MACEDCDFKKNRFFYESGLAGHLLLIRLSSVCAQSVGFADAVDLMCETQLLRPNQWKNTAVQNPWTEINDMTIILFAIFQMELILNKIRAIGKSAEVVGDIYKKILL